MPHRSGEQAEVTHCRPNVLASSSPRPPAVQLLRVVILDLRRARGIERCMGDEDITTLDTTTFVIEMHGPIIRSQTQQLNN
jgi:hypothetical protein